MQRRETGGDGVGDASFERIVCDCVCVVASPFGEFGIECTGSYRIAKEMTEFVHGSLCRPVVDPDRVQVTKVACRRSISAVEGKGWSK
jgi:hypothetical protein